MVVQRLLSAVVVTGLALSLAACGGDSDSGGSPSPGSSSSGAPGSTPTTTPSAEQPTSTTVKSTRTEAVLTTALLSGASVANGMTVDKSPEKDDGTSLSSTSSGCKDLVEILNADTAPGSQVSVARSYTGGEQGPFVDEGLDALGTRAEVTALVGRIAAAMKSCPKATLEVEGAGSSPVGIEEIKLPQTVGTSQVAFLLAAQGGALQGMQISFAFVALGDVILSLNTDRLDLLAPTTTKAARKASGTLGPGQQ